MTRSPIWKRTWNIWRRISPKSIPPFPRGSKSSATSVTSFFTARTRRALKPRAAFRSPTTWPRNCRSMWRSARVSWKFARKRCAKGVSSRILPNGTSNCKSGSTFGGRPPATGTPSYKGSPGSEVLRKLNCFWGVSSRENMATLSRQRRGRGLPSATPRERQSPDWRFAARQSGDWRSRGPIPGALSGQEHVKLLARDLNSAVILRVAYNGDENRLGALDDYQTCNARRIAKASRLRAWNGAAQRERRTSRQHSPEARIRRAALSRDSWIRRNGSAADRQCAAGAAQFYFARFAGPGEEPHFARIDRLS